MGRPVKTKSLMSTLFEMEMDNLVEQFEAKDEPREKTIKRIYRQFTVKGDSMPKWKVERLATEVRRKFYNEQKTK